MRANGKSITRAIGRGGSLKIETFWGLEMTTSETHIQKITNVPVFYMALGLHDFDGGKSITRPIGRAKPGQAKVNTRPYSIIVYWRVH